MITISFSNITSVFQTCHNKIVPDSFLVPHRTIEAMTETYINGPAKKASADVAPPNIKSPNLFKNVETGLESLKILLSSAILFWTVAMNLGRRVVPFSDWLT